MPVTGVLVRPDGYVGAIVASAGIAMLETYFDGVGLAAELRRHST